MYIALTSAIVYDRTHSGFETQNIPEGPKKGHVNQVKNLVRLSELDFEILILSLSILIGLPLDIISKCVNVLSKPTEPKVSSVCPTKQFKTEKRHNGRLYRSK